MMQDSSPLKYQNPANGLLSPLIDSMYVKQHNQKVKLLEQRVDRFVQSNSNLLPSQMQNNPYRRKGHSPSKQSTDHTTEMSRTDSKGLLDLFEGNDRRK
jgi:hypothetical protein